MNEYKEFIFYYRESDIPLEDDIHALKSHQDLEIVDEELSKVILVRANPEKLDSLRREFIKWRIIETKWYKKV